MITHVKFVGVPTRDQGRALKFYTEQLGLFTPEGHESRIGTFFNGSLACHDVEATYRQLRQRGVEFTSEPQQQPWGTFATFRDPDGNLFVLSSW